MIIAAARLRCIAARSGQGGLAGALELGGLIADSKGNLYGTTNGGGGSAYRTGTVIELTPHANAFEVWREAVLYASTGGSDGAIPQPA